MSDAEGTKRFHLFANWKMYALGMKSEEYFDQFFKSFPEEKAQKLAEASIGFAVPFTKISSLYSLFSSKGLSHSLYAGAQNMHSAEEGAYTGEIAYPLLQEAGAQWVLLGHSERRTLFGEQDHEVSLKARACDQKHFPSMICAGETKQQREEGKSDEVVASQISIALEKVKDRSRVWVAYEPVWAIGSGQSATTEQVAQMHKAIYEQLIEMGFEKSGIRIFYGGSVNLANCKDLAQIEHVDGFLVGKASLDPTTFAKMAETLL